MSVEGALLLLFFSNLATFFITGICFEKSANRYWKDRIAAFGYGEYFVDEDGENAWRFKDNTPRCPQVGDR